MRRLRDAGLVEALVGLAQPVLGICLGMQILFQRSEEGDAECLGVLPGVVGALRPGPEWRVPNMGWSQLAPARESARAAGAFAGSDGEMRGSDGEAGAGEALLRGIHADAYFYFVHSFAAPLGPWAAATSRDPRRIPAVVARRNFVGTQFHPERSGRPGARLLANFLGASQ
jgi:glutamine amidotransferase